MMPIMRLPRLVTRFPLLTLPLLALVACGGGKGSGEGETDSGLSGVGSANSEAGEAGEAEDTGPAPIDPVPVRGLQITQVTANQGVAVQVANGTTWLGPNERNAPLIAGRDTLLRAYFALVDGWVDRDVECRLQLTMPGGEIRNYTTILEDVYRDTNPRFLDSGCYFGLVADEGETAAGVEYSISIWDIQEGGEQLMAYPSQAPETGSSLVGFQDGTMNMKIRLVPVSLNGVLPDVQGARQSFEDGLFMMNPLQTIALDVRDPISSNSGSLSTMLSLMSQYHSQDGAPSNMYYFALVDTGEQSGVVGLAQLGSLYGAALWRNSLSSTVGTVVHEVGHDQGLGHVACPEVEGMPPYEPYPYTDGLIGKTGFGIRNFSLYGPDLNYAYMSYCGQGSGQWASDWDWNRNWSRIQQFSAQGFDLPTEPVLHGILEPDGTELWWTANDSINPELVSANYEVNFEREGETVTSLMAASVLSDGQSIWLSAPLPVGMDVEGAQITRSYLGESFSVELPAEKIFHGLRVARGQ